MALPGRKPIARTGSAPAASSKDKVHTATLLTGRIYIYKNQQFFAGVETVVTADVADVLEDLYNVTRDGDNEEYEKPLFRVQRNVPPPPPPVMENGEPKRQRTRLPVRPLYRERA